VKTFLFDAPSILWNLASVRSGAHGSCAPANGGSSRAGEFEKTLGKNLDPENFAGFLHGKFPD
jgi:hypothetical protein